MTKPKAVLISDVHYSLSTIHLANTCIKQAKDKANALNVPLIIAGDLHDTKAMMRAECVKAMLDNVSSTYNGTIVLIGNHCLINEKSKEHSLEFLRHQCHIIDTAEDIYDLKLRFIPYQSSQEDFKKELKRTQEGFTVIAHQGVQSAYLGHYVQDGSAVPKEWLDGYRVVSGHYHRRQDIRCGKTGLFSYIGNPFSLSFGEALDPPKGFQILMDDGSLEFVPTNLRKHVVLECGVDDVNTLSRQRPEDLVWVKVSGPQSKLNTVDKKRLGMQILGHSNYKLDLIPTDKSNIKQVNKDQTPDLLMDGVIDSMSETEEQKARLKALWRSLL